MSTGKNVPGQSSTKLVQLTTRAGKSYAFDEAHDPASLVDWWFQESTEGLILFTVFYTQACRWSLCTGCNLPSVGSQFAVGFPSIIAQIDGLFAAPKLIEKRNEVRKVIVSNNGSVLDQVTFPSTALMYLIAQINLQLGNLQVLSLETRVEYVDVAELEFLARAMKEREHPAVIELAVGFEAFSDRIRNDVFLKGLSVRAFEELVAKAASHQLRLKCYFMQKPTVGMSDDEAVEDIQQGIDYLSSLAERHGVAVNMHLNPTYVARGTPLEKSFLAGEYAPPSLGDVARAVLHGRGKPISIFVGLNDEGLAVDGGSFIRPGDESLVEGFEAFNKSRDFDALERSLGP
jgi:radical SAM enzyme (TIGR01210 family)